MRVRESAQFIPYVLSDLAILGMRPTSRAAVHKNLFRDPFGKLEVHGIKCYNSRGVRPRKYGLAWRQRCGDYLKLMKLIVAAATEQIYVLSECWFLVKRDTQIPDSG